MDSSRHPSKNGKKHKAATFQLQDLPHQGQIHGIRSGDRGTILDQESRNTNPSTNAMIEETPYPTRFRPGTPSPSRTNSPHVKKKIHQMSLSDIDNDGEDKRMHVISGSKSAPVPRHHGHHGHHHTHQSHGHHGLKQQQMQQQLKIPDDIDKVVDGPVIKNLLEHSHVQSLAVSSTGPSSSRHYSDREPKVVLAIVKGFVFIPTRTRQRPVTNSFIETNDLGPPGADRRWLIDMKGFREDEITFTLDGPTLKIEGKQNTRPGKLAHHVETIVLPISYDIENLKVYRNKVIGTLVLAYLPSIPSI